MKKLSAMISAAAAAMMMAGCATTGTETATTDASASSSLIMSLGIMVVFFIAMYFMAIRPQKKQEKEHRELLASMAVGDTILTTSGFYGVVIDITDDTIIVEFGNNKNCRIPMQKAAVVQLEHPEGYEKAQQEELAKMESDKK